MNINSKQNKYWGSSKYRYFGAQIAAHQCWYAESSRGLNEIYLPIAK